MGQCMSFSGLIHVIRSPRLPRSDGVLFMGLKAIPDAVDPIRGPRPELSKARDEAGGPLAANVFAFVSPFAADHHAFRAPAIGSET